MMATPDIQELVRDGRVSPQDGARLLEIQRDLKEHRDRQEMRRKHPWLSAAVAVGLFVLWFLGGRRE